MNINNHQWRGTVGVSYRYRPPQRKDGKNTLVEMWDAFYKISRKLYLPGFNAETDTSVDDTKCAGVNETVDKNGTPCDGVIKTPVTAYVLPSADYSYAHYKAPLFSKPKANYTSYKWAEAYGQAMIDYYTGNLLKNYDKGETFKTEIKKYGKTETWAFEADRPHSYIENYLYAKEKGLLAH